MDCKSGYCYQPVTKHEFKKYDGYCHFCFANLYPEHESSLFITRKSKELKVISYLLNILKEWIYDKGFYVDLEGGCCSTRRRIDLRYLYLNTMICIEIDENQHKNYIQINEEARYNDLFMDFSGKYVFIRYNPDEYKDENKIKQNPDFNIRMKILINIVHLIKLRIYNELNSELIEIYNVFYDENDENENDKILELSEMLSDNESKYNKILEIETDDEKKMDEINEKMKKHMITKIICEYCNKEVCKSKINRHQNSKLCRNKQHNKNIKLELKEYKCMYCEKIFNRNDYKNEHESMCTSKDIYYKLTNIINETKKELELKNELLKQKDNEVIFLKSQLQIYKPSVNYTNDYSTNSTTNIENNITINNFNIDFNQIQDHIQNFNIHILSDHNNIINFLMNIYKNKMKLTNECKKVITYYVNDKLINDKKCKVFLSNCANQLNYRSDIVCQESKKDKLLSDNIIKNVCENNIMINRICTEKGVKRGVRTDKITSMVNEVVKILKECGLVDIKGL
jgi:hypothetical protein